MGSRQSKRQPPYTPGYDLFCAGHSFLADGRLFVAGGHILNGVGLANASIYDPLTVATYWTHLPDMNFGRWYPTVTVLANGDILVVSGSIDNTVGANMVPQVFQFGSGTWRNLSELFLDLYPICCSRQTARSSIRHRRRTPVILMRPGAVPGALSRGGSAHTAITDRR